MSDRMLLERVEKTMHDRELLAGGRRGVVAFSGGPDSLCLLHLVTRLRGSLQLELVAVHVDHGLRPESADEAARALAQARALGVEAVSRRAIVETGPGHNLQETARLARRALLDEEADRLGAGWIALGHTGLDQAETVLMRVVRGCGLPGLAGMSWREGRVIRPLLEVSRAEVLAYLEQHGLHAVEDPSNLTPRFLRNRLRREVVPLLERENPAFLEAIARLTETCREESEALEELAQESYDAAAGRSSGAVELELAALRSLPPGLLHRVLRLAFVATTGSARRLERSHLLALARLCRDRHGTAHLDLPGVDVERCYDRLRLCHGQPPELVATGEIRIDAPGVFRLGDGRSVELVQVQPGAAPGPFLAALNAERVGFPLTLRGLRAGDRIRIARARSRKVARLLLDAKIPRRERSRVPLLLAGSEVLVVAGVRCAFGLEPVQGASVLLLRWSPELTPRGAPCRNERDD